MRTRVRGMVGGKRFFSLTHTISHGSRFPNSPIRTHFDETITSQQHKSKQVLRDERSNLFQHYQFLSSICLVVDFSNLLYSAHSLFEERTEERGRRREKKRVWKYRRPIFLLPNLLKLFRLDVRSTLDEDFVATLMRLRWPGLDMIQTDIKGLENEIFISFYLMKLGFYLEKFQSFCQSSSLLFERENDRRLAWLDIHVSHVRVH